MANVIIPELTTFAAYSQLDITLEMNKPKKRIRFIVNPVSGVHQSEKAALAEQLSQTLNQQQFSWEVLFSESAEQVQQLSREAAAANTDIIAAVGGDGTVNQAVRGMIGSNSTLAVIPAGSGNGLAHHLGIPVDIVESIAVINKLKIKTIDTATINDELFVSIAGVGFDALVAKKFEKAGRRGFLSYFKIVSTEYPEYQPEQYSLIVDGKRLEREALFISFANTNQFGYNTVISPTARIDDGLLDVCIVKKVPVIYAPYIVGLLLTRKIDTSEYLEIIKAKHISIIRNNASWVNIDGEPQKLDKELDININPATLNIMVP